MTGPHKKPRTYGVYNSGRQGVGHSKSKGCGVCGAFWHSRTRCPEIGNALGGGGESPDPTWRQKAGRVTWSPWMLLNPEAVGYPDPEIRSA